MQKDEIINKLMAISDINVGGYNEENVKIHVVIKLLDILGHRDHLDMEHSYGANRPDIFIKGFEQPIIVEVKGANENLKIQEIAYKYSDKANWKH